MTLVTVKVVTFMRQYLTRQRSELQLSMFTFSRNLNLILTRKLISKNVKIITDNYLNYTDSLRLFVDILSCISCLNKLS